MSTISDALSSEDLGFDPQALTEKYQHERNRRIRADAEAQFVEVSNDSPFANKYLEEDPYSELIEREPIFDEKEVIIAHKNIR